MVTQHFEAENQQKKKKKKKKNSHSKSIFHWHFPATSPFNSGGTCWSLFVVLVVVFPLGFSIIDGNGTLGVRSTHPFSSSSCTALPASLSFSLSLSLSPWADLLRLLHLLGKVQILKGRQQGPKSNKANQSCLSNNVFKKKKKLNYFLQNAPHVG